MTGTMRAALALLLIAGTACSPGGTGERRAPAAAGTPTAATTSGRPSTTGTGGEDRAGTPAASSPAPAGTPAVTLDAAAKVVRTILRTDDALRAAGGESYALAQTRDAQTPIAATAFQSTGMRPPRYTWSTAKLLVPRLDRFPHWFAALAERRDERGRSRTAVLAFMRQSETSRWQLSFASLLYPGAGQPAVRLDGEGYAIPLATRDDSVAISPHLMAPLHATIAEEGPGGFAAGLIAAGPQTTGYFTEVGEIQPEAKRRGLLYDSIFAATTFPIYALRAIDGGAVILYSLTRTTLLQVKTDNALGLVPVPKQIRWAVDGPVVRRKLRVLETHQYVSHVSRKGAAEPAKVIGFDGTPTAVTSDMPVGD